MIRNLNRKFQDYMRPKRLALGKWIWDRKEKKEEIDLAKLKSILFLRYEGKIGDMVVTTYMFREIKKKYPNLKIGVVSRGAAVDIIKNNPHIDTIYEYIKGKESILGKKISDEKYDLLIDFSEILRVKDMKLINLCNAKVNIGINKKNWKLFDISIEPEKDFNWSDHITRRYECYLKKIDIMESNKSYDLYLDTKIPVEEKIGKKEELTVIINPYGASKHKHFNENTLDKIIKYLLEKKCKIIFIYYPKKYSELKLFLKNYEDETINLPENIKTILDSSKIIEKGDIIITPDTSIVHIATALNKKIISVYPPKGGDNKVDHLVWGPLDIKNKMIFCEDKKNVGDEIDINTFKFEDFKERFESLEK